MELFYLLCYPMVPAGLVVLYFGGLKDASDLYWSAVLIPTYICYALVPLLGTLPPRICETGGPVLRAEPIRLFNLWILKNASTNINMIPSGHVTASLAAALVLLDLMPLAGIVALMIALGIAAGAFGGRYHFAADVILAVLLTLTTNIPLL
jgi:hypothetical protein